MPSSLPVALTLSFADSEVACVSAASDGVRIRLSAAQVRRSAAAGGVSDTLSGAVSGAMSSQRFDEMSGTSSEEGFARGVELLLPGACLSEPVGHFIGRVSHGRVRRGGQWSGVMPLTFLSAKDSEIAGAGDPDRNGLIPRGISPEVTPEITLELSFANHSQLVLVATGIGCRFEGDANFSESLFC